MKRESPRRQAILEVLAAELESNPGARITTATLARAVGVSEAALYRHFASKTQMFEGLIDFAESSVFALFNQVMREQQAVDTRCLHLCLVVLGFAARNPGITRLLMGDILLGEHPRLHQRVRQFFARVETQFKQVLREGMPNANQATIAARAALLHSVLLGRLDRFVRDEFRSPPGAGWDEQWALLGRGVFAPAR